MAGGATRYEDGSIGFEEFEESDPRRGPHALSVLAEAAALARSPGRWHHRKRHVDWLAVRLAVGRGYASSAAGLMFGIDASHIRKRVRDERWVSPMTERDRRELSVMVWLAGWAHLTDGDAESRDALKRTSAWQARKVEQAVWREKDPQGEPLQFTINDETPDDAYFSAADPARDERRSVVDKLETRLRELEAEWEAEQEREEEEEQDESAAEGAEAEDRAGEGADQAGAVADVLGESGSGGTGVEGVGPPEPASA
jgi:hypothetical protein